MAFKTRELTWSLSKARMIEECPRRYYYHYYFAQAGYSPDAPDGCRLALEMKRIQHLDMWVGDAVHTTIQWILEEGKHGRVPSAEEARANVRGRLSNGWQGSVKQLWRTGNGDHLNLFEHYYKLPVGDAAIERVKQKAYTSVRNFMESDILREIVDTPGDRWLPIDKYASFRMDGVLLYVKFDFALRDGPRLTVYDWKTGKPTAEELRQLTCYAMYATETWRVPMENTKVCAVHLQPQLETCEHLIGVSEMDELREYIRQSFKGMVSHLRNPSRNIAALDDFPMTGNLPRCLRCNFKGICPQAEIAEGRMTDDIPMPEGWDE
jgi:hypothetical protein